MHFFKNLEKKNAGKMEDVKEKGKYPLLPDPEVAWFWEIQSTKAELPPNICNKLELSFQEEKKGRKIDCYFEVQDLIYVADFGKMVLIKEKGKDGGAIKIFRGYPWRLECFPTTSKLLLEEIEKGRWYFCSGKENSKFGDDEDGGSFLVAFEESIQPKIEEMRKKRSAEIENLFFNFDTMTCTHKESKKERKILRVNEEPFWCFFNAKREWQLFTQKENKDIEDSFKKGEDSFEISNTVFKKKVSNKIFFREMKMLSGSGERRVRRFGARRELEEENASNNFSSLGIFNEEEIEESNKENKRKWVARVKEMLWTSPRNFKMIDPPKSLIEENQPEGMIPIKREDFQVESNVVFTAEGILSPQECDYFIQKTEQAGYEDLTRQFEKEYRGAETILVLDEQMADSVWKRVQQTLKDEDLLLIKPMGFGNEGTWKASRLNQCFKFSKYVEGTCFKGHIDGPWVPMKDESSVFTVVIYLNDDFEGGETNFYREPLQSKLEGKRGVAEEGDLVASVKPKKGKILVFTHESYHEGAVVKKGVKYVVRTEIMFRRVDSSIFHDRFLSKNEEYKKMVTLYQKSWQHEAEGNVKEFTDTYLQALKIQRNARTAPLAQNTVKKLPRVIWTKILWELKVNDVCSMMSVSKAFYAIARDGRIWRKLFLESPLPMIYNFVGPASNFLNYSANLLDWYNLFKFHHSRAFSPSLPVFSVDLGRCFIKTATTVLREGRSGSLCSHCRSWKTSNHYPEIDKNFCVDVGSSLKFSLFQLIFTFKKYSAANVQFARKASILTETE